MYSKLLAIQSLSIDDISFIKSKFKRVTELLEKGLYDESREEMADCIMKLQLKRSIDGFGIQVERF